MSQGEKKGNPIPNWLLFLFFGTLVWGALYLVFMHGFLGYSQTLAYEVEAGTDIVRGSLPEKPPKDASAIANGEASSASCAGCHGAGLTGTANAPNLMDDEWLHGKRTEKDLFALITRGISGSDKKFPSAMPMPASGSLRPGRQVWEVIYYLSSKNHSIVQDSEE